MTRHIHTLTRHLEKVYEAVNFSEAALRRRTIRRFAFKLGLVYFKSSPALTEPVSVIRGSTESLDQTDSDICIGTHDGYDLVLTERAASTAFAHYPIVYQRWHVMEFDLHTSGLPFLFIGTHQQNRTFYARMFAARHQVRHIDMTDFGQIPARFHAHYTVIAVPSEQEFITRVFTPEVTKTMLKHQHPFAIEIQGDSLFVFTEATQTTIQSLTRMLHYGLWLAQHIDAAMKPTDKDSQ